VNAPSTFAERIWLGVSPNGEKHRIVLRVGAPVQKARSEWSCIISLGALDDRTDEIAGADSWQAVEQSMLHVAKRVAVLERCGWRFFFWDAQDDPASYTDLLHSE
jgi:hypothetical protein